MRRCLVALGALIALASACHADKVLYDLEDSGGLPPVESRGGEAALPPRPPRPPYFIVNGPAGTGAHADPAIPTLAHRDRRSYLQRHVGEHGNEAQPWAALVGDQQR